MAEVGVGNLNWPAIIKSCRAAGVEWYLIEQGCLLSRSVRQSADVAGESEGTGRELI